MSYHSGTIHTVRFSSSGKFLASGADDKIVCVYTLDPNPPSHSATFGMCYQRRRDGCDSIADALIQVLMNPLRLKIGASFAGLLAMRTMSKTWAGPTTPPYWYLLAWIQRS